MVSFDQSPINHSKMLLVRDGDTNGWVLEGWQLIVFGLLWVSEIQYSPSHIFEQCSSVLVLTFLQRGSVCDLVFWDEMHEMLHCICHL